MKKCKCCNIEDAVKYSKYSDGNFCSSKCARSFSTKEKRGEINKKVSIKLFGRKSNNSLTLIGIKNRATKNNIPLSDEEAKAILIERWRENGIKISKAYNNKILNADYSTLSFERLKKRIVLEQNECCNKCGLTEWIGTKLTLELEHIDGNHSNNNRENLEALCPNCHSLTPTWRGRNKKNNLNRGRISDEELFGVLLENNFNMRQSLLAVGLAAKGGNYIRCHKLKRMYDDFNL